MLFAGIVRVAVLTVCFALISSVSAPLFAQAPSPGSSAPAPSGSAAPSASSAAPAGSTAAPAGTSEEKGKASAAGKPVPGMLDELLNSGAMGYMTRGGIFMWPILFLGVLAAAVIMERFRSLQLLSTDSAALRRQVLELLAADRVDDALAICERARGPVPAILSAGLRRFVLLRNLNYDPARIEEQVVQAMDDYGVHITGALEKNLSILATVSSVAPMVGFLGTVQGMIISFDDIVAKLGEMNIVEAAAGGISVALITTAFGLIVGIPAFVGFNYFTGVINRFVLDVESSATQLIELVTMQMAARNRDAARV